MAKFITAERAAVEELKAQLKANPDIVFQRDEDEETSLHKAADDGNDAVAEVLLAHGADVNAKDALGGRLCTSLCVRDMTL